MDMLCFSTYRCAARLRRSCLALLVVGLAVTNAVHAADRQGRFAVRGAGSLTCKQLITGLESKDPAVRREMVLLHISWLDGYLTSLNRTAADTFDAVPFVSGADMLAVVLTQCRSRQDSLVEVVLHNTIAAMSASKVGQDSPVVTVTVGKRSCALRRHTIIAIQRKLIEHRLLTGKPDGLFKDATRKALAGFQRSVKHEATGFPDIDTILKLLLS